MTDAQNFVRAMIDGQRKDDEVRTAMLAIGTKVLREPALASDVRVLSPWLAALAVTGIASDAPEGYSAWSKVPHRFLWREGDARTHVECLEPVVRERVSKALELIAVYRAEVQADKGDVAARVTVRRFTSVVGALVQPNESAVATRPAQRDRGRHVKREVLVADNHRRWPTIERDLKDASRNGLSERARGEKHGWWYEGDARTWAVGAGKMKDTTLPTFISHPHLVGD